MDKRRNIWYELPSELVFTLRHEEFSSFTTPPVPVR